MSRKLLSIFDDGLPFGGILAALTLAVRGVWKLRNIPKRLNALEVANEQLGRDRKECLDRENELRTELLKLSGTVEALRHTVGEVVAERNKWRARAYESGGHETYTETGSYAALLPPDSEQKK